MKRADLMALAFIAIIAIIAIAACGTQPPYEPGEHESLFPLTAGDSWTFVVRETDGDVKQKIQSVEEDKGDGSFILRTETDGDAFTVSVQAVIDGQLVRVSEESGKGGVVTDRIRFDPPDVRVDLKASRLGAGYDSNYVEHHLDASGNVISSKEKRHHFVVEAVDQAIDVPAGQFRALRVRRDQEGGSSKTYWFVRGVGKIREVGGQVEELSAWELK